MKSAFLFSLCVLASTVFGCHGLQAVAVLKNDEGAHGVVTFDQPNNNGPTSIHAEVWGLPAGKHGFHVHEYGDLTQGCNSTLAHYNPFNVTHGAPTDKIHHVGDLGNIESSGPDQAAVLDITADFIHLQGDISVLGRAILIHTGEDDLGRGNSPLSKTTGNAGGRFLCAVIGWAAPKQ
ncbi:copper/zinc superoxide dismutase [Halteromyces radiatus]|uniref:copper/zinc superoxide dismutase n=1 Tax=Halteromyces radiatus TaxID=101107 RepID=UPI002220A11B|nr:copper/zinc superoxide dismutase [Halteromyces radiatus]KAI8083154.1 copper/zinc superoxide dismutase [Halteromyces radiatus]